MFLEINLGRFSFQKNFLREPAIITLHSIGLILSSESQVKTPGNFLFSILKPLNGSTIPAFEEVKQAYGVNYYIYQRFNGR